jgi:hypothetical protein
MLEHDKRFTDAEQKEIIGLAARLQRESGMSMSADELTQVAAEAGIEPAYVQEAISRLQERPREAKPSTSTPTAIVALLLVAQWFGMFSMFADHLGSWSGFQWWIVFGLCFSLGAIFSKTSKSRMTAVAITVCSALAVGILCGGFVWSTTDRVVENWPEFFRNIVIGEVLVTLAGAVVGKSIERLVNRGLEKKFQTPHAS